MVSNPMTQTFIVEYWTVLSKEKEVVARDLVEVPFCVLDVCSISIDVELVAVLWVSVVRRNQMVSMVVTVAFVFVFSSFGVVGADEVAWLLVVPDHEVGRGVSLSVFPEFIAPLGITVEGGFIMNMTIFHIF